MTATQKHEAFAQVVLQVRAIERRHKQQCAVDQARAAFNAYYSDLERERDQARKDGGFSLLRK